MREREKERKSEREKERKRENIAASRSVVDRSCARVVPF